MNTNNTEAFDLFDFDNYNFICENILTESLADVDHLRTVLSTRNVL